MIYLDKTEFESRVLALAIETFKAEVITKPALAASGAHLQPYMANARSTLLRNGFAWKEQPKQRCSVCGAVEAKETSTYDSKSIIFECGSARKFCDDGSDWFFRAEATCKEPPPQDLHIPLGPEIRGF